jgi:hypothetical protein
VRTLDETTSGSDGAAAIETLLELPTRLDSATAKRIDGVMIGVLVGFDAQERPLVTYEGQPGSSNVAIPPGRSSSGGSAEVPVGAASRLPCRWMSKRMASE